MPTGVVMRVRLAGLFMNVVTFSPTVHVAMPSIFVASR